LSIPLRLLKYFELDDVNTVRNSYYVAHALLVIIGDYFFIKLGKSLVGNFPTKVALYYYLTNKFYNTHIIHAFINSTESILTMVLFHIYFKMQANLDKNTIVFTILIVISFMNRATSIIGWIPLILY
jgi:hypothetical protein